MAAVLSDRGHRSDAGERPAMTTYRNRRAQAWRCTHIPATTHAGLHLEARQTDSDGLAAVAHPPIKRHGACILLGTGATISAQPPGAACAGRHGAGCVWGIRKR